MQMDLSAKLGIKPGDKVCLLHPNQETLSQIESDQVNLIVDKVEKGCDLILYWVDASENIEEKARDWQSKIKPDGRIWVITPRKEVARKRNLDIDWNHIQSEVLKTHLVDNKMASINDEEYGTQFVIRKEYRAINN
jgi:hypothetical protein